MLVNTKKAAEQTGLSQYELRRGFRQGRYPAIVIGSGEERRTLRWNVELLQRVLFQEFELGDENDKKVTLIHGS